MLAWIILPQKSYFLCPKSALIALLFYMYYIWCVREKVFAEFGFLNQSLLKMDLKFRRKYKKLIVWWRDFGRHNNNAQNLKCA